MLLSYLQEMLQWDYTACLSLRLQNVTRMAPSQFPRISLIHSVLGLLTGLLIAGWANHSSAQPEQPPQYPNTADEKPTDNIRAKKAQSAPPQDAPARVVPNPDTLTQKPNLFNRQWIRDLDANQYVIREQAQRHLTEAGIQSLAAVTQTARQGSLESSTRALNILLAWSDSTDAQLRIAALERIATLANRPKESSIASGLLSDAREQVALQAIAQLGGYYLRDRQIHGINNLQIVIGKNWQGGIDGLEHLAHIPRATTISFYSPPLPDDALDDLSRLPQILRIELYGTDFSPQAVKKIKESVSSRNVKIDERDGALLGIRGNVAVTEVERDSAAFRAGIQPGDRITRIDEHDVANFEELTARIAKHKPGDTVTLTVLRNKEITTKKVTFGHWGELAPNKRPIKEGRKNAKNTPLMPKKTYIERR